MAAVVARIYHYPRSAVGAGKVAGMVMRQTWEYAVAVLSPDKSVHIMMDIPQPNFYILSIDEPYNLHLIQLLNQMGRDGWELVNTVCDGVATTMYFKRPIE